ncbi:MAG: citramalate synthase [Desulfatiglandales bacterium]
MQTWLSQRQTEQPELKLPGLGIHTHNDSGLAVANSIAAVEAGVEMVQGTINGYGERCGNADLLTLIGVLQLKMGYRCIDDENLTRLTALSHFVSEVANLVPSKKLPFVGRSAFAHKGGVHVSAVLKNPAAYEHIPPEKVGNQRRVLVSDLSGRGNVLYKAKELGIDLRDRESDVANVVEVIKGLEAKGYQFEAAEASLELLIRRAIREFVDQFSLESFRVTIEKDRDRETSSHATIKIAVGDEDEITAAEGDGPVNALDNALRKALSRFSPQVQEMRLIDFKVRVINGDKGTAARVLVQIDSSDGRDVWTTVGASENVIEASWQALVDSVHYKLLKDGKSRRDEISEETAADLYRNGLRRGLTL